MDRLLGALEKLAKVAAVLAAFGYLSMRGNLNYLGIPFVASLGLERYLMEAFNFFFGALTHLTPLLFLLLALVWVVLAGWLLWSWFSKRGPARPGSLRRWRREVLIHPASAMAMATVALLGLLGILLSLEVNVAIGPLQAASLGDRGEWRFELALPACALGLLITQAAIKELALPPQKLPRHDLSRSVWRLTSYVLLFLLIAVLPLLFGQAIAPTKFRLAKVVSGTQAFCGLLVLKTDEEILLWQTVGRQAQVVVLPLEQVDAIGVGRPFDLLKIASQAAVGSPEPLPSCQDLDCPVPSSPSPPRESP